VEADLGALLENETQKLGPGRFYLKTIITWPISVDLHVRTLFPSQQWGKEVWAAPGVISSLPPSLCKVAAGQRRHWSGEWLRV
jgi:hypothetical protein